MSYGADGRAFELARRYQVPLGLLVVAVLLRPVVAHPWVLGFEQVATTILIWIVFVTAFNLLFGFTGLLSFGHAMFLGIGMYGVAIGLSRFGLPFFVGATVGILAGAVLGHVLGRLIVDRGEIYFAMLTLAFAQAVFFIANRDPGGLTGGDNGITQDVLPAWIETYRGDMNVVAGSLSVDWYWVVAAVFLVCMLGVWQLVRSPFGRSLVAIRENEALARAMGIDTYRYKVAAFTVSGGLAALAGVLLEINDQGAVLATFGVFTSGDAVLMAILGGVRYFFGPVVGVVIWFFAEDYLTDFDVLNLPASELALVSIDLSGVLGHWRFFMGALFVVIVMVSPKDGAWGFVRRRVHAVVERIRDHG